MLEDIREILCDSRNEINAAKMSAYMKNKFAFFGIKSPERKILFKEIFLELKALKQSDLHSLVRDCWIQEEREFHYLAMEALFRSKKQWNKESLEVMTEQVCENSWWDTVDYVASNSIGLYLKDKPSLLESVTTSWNESENLWLIRTSLIFQLKYKDQQNSDLLSTYILRHRHSKEFFIQKAAGWALRQYSKYNPKWVIAFVQQNDLPSLSKREALKYFR